MNVSRTNGVQTLADGLPRGPEAFAELRRLSARLKTLRALARRLRTLLRATPRAERYYHQDANLLAVNRLLTLLKEIPGQYVAQGHGEDEKIIGTVLGYGSRFCRLALRLERNFKPRVALQFNQLIWLTDCAQVTHAVLLATWRSDHGDWSF